MTTKSDALRVWHLLGALRPSGMERMLVSAASEWPERVDGKTIIGQGSDHPFRGALEVAGYSIFTVESTRTRAGLRQLRELVAAGKPDILHVHTEVAFAPVVVATSGHTTIVRTVHSVFPVRGRASWSRRLQRAIADRRVSQFVAPSSDVADNERLIGRSCDVILNWVAPEFDNARTDVVPAGWAIMVGNASRVKNHVVGLRAVLELGIPLAYVGDETGASIEESVLLDELSRRGQLVHRGVGDPLPYLERASVFVMPSLYEGMGVALAEALQIGLPAVISEAPGLRWAAHLPGVSVVRGFETGWSNAIAEAALLGRDPARAHPDFTARRGIAEYVSTYRAVLQPRTRATS